MHNRIFVFCALHPHQSNSATRLRLMSGLCTWRETFVADMIVLKDMNEVFFWLVWVYLGSMKPESGVDNDEIACVGRNTKYIFSDTNMFLPIPSPKNQPLPTWIEGGLHGWVTRGGALGGRSEVPGLNTTYLSLVSTDI